jgi:hypothetical protein
MLLTAEDDGLANQLPGRFGRTWFGIMLLSLLWGASSMVLYSWTWGLFGDFSGIPLMPVVVVLVVGLMGLYARCLLALAESLVKGEPRRCVAVAVIVAAWVLMLLGLKSWNPNFPYYLPYIWQWTRPRMMFRPLLLAPIWGGWAMLLAVQFCRPTERSEPVVAAFARGCTPLATTAVLTALLMVTMVYFNHLPWTQLSISATAIVTAAVGGVLLCRRWGGLCRAALLATNMLTQIAFVLAYLANR